MISKTYKVKVEFYDVDSMNVVWHGNYVKFLESARCKFLDEIGYNYIDMKNDGFAYPIAKMSFKFIKPTFFNDKLEVEIILQAIESFLSFKYIIKNSKNEKVCEAFTSQACLKIENHQTQFVAPDKLKKCIKKVLK